MRCKPILPLPFDKVFFNYFYHSIDCACGTVELTLKLIDTMNMIGMINEIDMMIMIDMCDMNDVSIIRVAPYDMSDMNEVSDMNDIRCKPTRGREDAPLS